MKRISFDLSSRALLIGSFALVAAGMMILTGATLWSHHINRIYAARADMAFRQALEVSQLELAASGAGAMNAQERQTLSDKARQYLATIEEEERLLDAQGADARDQADERATAHRLIAAIMTEGEPADLARVRAIASDIATREVREAARARAEAETIARQTRYLVIITAGGVLLVPVLLMIVLQRQLVIPLRSLGALSRDLALNRHSDRPIPTGLTEIRALTERFNAMADAVEARVAERTSELEQANRELAEVDTRRRLFLAKVSHELRTPVTAIRGEAEVSLRHGGSSQDLREAVEHIEQTTLFLQRRLDDLMVLAKAEDALLPMQPGLVDPFAVARTACMVAAGYARASNVQIAAMSLPPGMAESVQVPGNEDRLQQAIAAVIDNAIKFSPPGGTVTVSSGIEGGTAVIRIADEGPGVAEPELAQIFDPYVQGQAGRALGGTGLGLSLARWIVEAYDGTISARRSREENIGAEGLCVILRLPIVG